PLVRNTMLIRNTYLHFEIFNLIFDMNFQVTNLSSPKIIPAQRDDRSGGHIEVADKYGTKKERHGMTMTPQENTFTSNTLEAGLRESGSLNSNKGLQPLVEVRGRTHLTGSLPLLDLQLLDIHLLQIDHT
ncbi:hypothetical protein KKA00_10445, partial [bacterium]|nr:hypothetical protein [bacterium]MBU1652630.1 hypothetical protein [bacterium]